MLDSLTAFACFQFDQLNFGSYSLNGMGTLALSDFWSVTKFSAISVNDTVSKLLHLFIFE